MTLRFSLREQTAKDHAEIEALFETLDLSREAGMAAFLAAHASVLAAFRHHLRGRIPRSMIAGALIEKACNLDALISTDLVTLGYPPAVPRAALPSAPLHPLGLAYVVAGSRLGAKLLRRHAYRSDSARVRAACTYLQAPEGDALWPAFVGHLRTHVYSEHESREILSSASAGFRCFETAFYRAKDFVENVGPTDAVEQLVG